MTLTEAAGSTGRRVRFVDSNAMTGYGWVTGVAAGRVMMRMDYGTKIVPVKAGLLTLVPDDEGRADDGASAAV